MEREETSEIPEPRVVEDHRDPRGLKVGEEILDLYPKIYVVLYFKEKISSNQVLSFFRKMTLVIHSYWITILDSFLFGVSQDSRYKNRLNVKA